MNKEKMKSVPGGVLGIVGGAVMLVGAFILIYAVVTIAELLEEGSVALTDEGIFGRSVAGIFTYLISGALGLSGGIIAIRKDNKLGAILIFIAAVMGYTCGSAACVCYDGSVRCGRSDRAVREKAYSPAGILSSLSWRIPSLRR